MQTKIHYLYRDASNYKIWGEEVLDGKISREDFTFHEENFFTPAEIGIPDLRNELIRQGYELNEDDHDWHEFIELEKI